ncbi:hypothetical protein STXM2123_3095 [Streptomyces sp. F-3]|nr:hypothetical protein STXM2123_3095 [Streptomyces sp. F-3]
MPAVQVLRRGSWPVFSRFPVPLGAAGLMLLFPEDGGEQAPPVGAVVLEERRPAASPEAVSTPGSTRRPVNALAPFRG